MTAANTTRMLLTLACAGALLWALAGTHVAAQEGEGASPTAPADNPEGGDGNKKDEASPNAPTESAKTPPKESDGGPLSLADLTRDGFEIRATNFIPAEAVTRQSGKIAADAFIVTLQKSGSTAVCFYTLKAYLGKKLGTIPACTVHR